MSQIFLHFGKESHKQFKSIYLSSFSLYTWGKIRTILRHFKIKLTVGQTLIHLMQMFLLIPYNQQTCYEWLIKIDGNFHQTLCFEKQNISISVAHFLIFLYVNWSANFNWICSFISENNMCLYQVINLCTINIFV